MSESEIATALMSALSRIGVLALVSVRDYKDAPGGPLLELMLTPAQAEEITTALAAHPFDELSPAERDEFDALLALAATPPEMPSAEMVDLFVSRLGEIEGHEPS